MVESACAFFDRAQHFEDLFELVPRLDLLIYTPAEYARLTAAPRVGFWRSVVQQSQRIL